MISPETYYEENLKGKSADEIMVCIEDLKQEIDDLKATMGDPEYALQPHIMPDESTQLSCAREYLDRAKEALEEAGGTYTPTEVESEDAAFQESIPYINSLEFSIGGYFNGFTTRTFTFKDDLVHMEVQTGLQPDRSHISIDLDENFCDENDVLFDCKDALLSELGELHIGEWEEAYIAPVCDGQEWHLEISYSDKRDPAIIYGNEAYPYNFDELKTLLEVPFEEDAGTTDGSSVLPS